MDEDELEKLKEEKVEGMQSESGEDQEERIRKQLKQVASQILTEDARSRLGNVRVADEDLASAIEYQLVQLYKAGQIRGKIDDDQLKELLKKVKEAGDEPDIKYTKPR
ncbi:MAG: DNA-binding protein [Candidatus Nanohaloarchaea archaeon]|nr:DNA-binding protein [Candidatus Nanohaloarchaea archaeon]